MMALEGTIYRPMDVAPKMDTDIYVLTRSGEHLACYFDCASLRAIDPTLADCWRPVEPWRNDIELHEAIGWRESD